MEATNGDSEKTMQSAQRHRHTDKVSSPFPELIGKGLRESWKMMALFLIISMVEGIAFITTTAPLTMADPDMHLPSMHWPPVSRSISHGHQSPTGNMTHALRRFPAACRSAADNCSQEKHDISKAA